MPSEYLFGNEFLNHERIPGITFEHNDCVRVIDGPYAGQTGCTVNISALEPEPRYTVELGASGHDIDVRQGDLELIARDSKAPSDSEAPEG